MGMKLSCLFGLSMVDLAVHWRVLYEWCWGWSELLTWTSGVSSPIPKKIIQRSMLFYAFSTYFLKEFFEKVQKSKLQPYTGRGWGSGVEVGLSCLLRLSVVNPAIHWHAGPEFLLTPDRVREEMVKRGGLGLDSAPG